MAGEEIDNDGTIESAATSLLLKPQLASPPAAPKPNGTNGAHAAPRVPEGDDVPVDEPDTSPPVDDPVDETVDQQADDDVDLDEIEIDVLIDGQPAKAKIGDLKARYSGEGAIEKRLQEATELRQRLDQVGQNTFQLMEQQKARLKQMDELLAQNQPQNIDWEALRVKDPGKYLLERERFRDIQDRRNRLFAEHQRIQNEQNEIQEASRQRYLEGENRALLKKIPELADPVKSTEFNNNMVQAAQHYGYSAEEYASVMDHRAIMVLRDANLWREQQAKLKKTVDTKQVNVKPLLKAGKAQQPRTTVAARIAAAAVKKARETGKPDDVAKTLLMGPRRRT